MCSYFNKVEAIGHPTYVPSEEDYLKSRVRTSGIIENTFTIDKLEWIISDVGGQRNERRKWIHCFDKVNAVIFVASLSEYDQTLFEAEGKNRLQEALDLFSEIIRTKFLKNSSVILFLNKDDLFRKKIEKVDIRDVETHRFEDYTGGCNYDAGIAYIRDAFLKLVPKAPCQAHNTLGCSDSACKRLVVRGDAMQTRRREGLKGAAASKSSPHTDEQARLHGCSQSPIAFC